MFYEYYFNFKQEGPNINNFSSKFWFLHVTGLPLLAGNVYSTMTCIMKPAAPNDNLSFIIHVFFFYLWVLFMPSDIIIGTARTDPTVINSPRVIQNNPTVSGNRIELVTQPFLLPSTLFPFKPQNCSWKLRSFPINNFWKLETLFSQVLAFLRYIILIR